MKQELNKLRQTSHTVEMEYAEVEGELTKDNSDLRDQLNELNSNHQLEHQQRIEAEREVSRIRKNKHDLQLELTSNKHEYAQRLQDRDTEICRLRNQVLMKSEKGPQQNELEKRIHHLTETLLTKQSVIENLNTSKHSLGLQLERSQVSKIYNDREHKGRKFNFSKMRLFLAVFPHSLWRVILFITNSTFFNLKNCPFHFSLN